MGRPQRSFRPPARGLSPRPTSPVEGTSGRVVRSTDTRRSDDGRRPRPDEVERDRPPAPPLRRLRPDGRGDEVLRYSQDRWPTCCGNVMVYYVEANPATADATPLDLPRLPPT